jgi:outer membrane biosynthesis protein TonB
MGKHATWARLCPERVARGSRAGAAYAARPNLYKIPAMLTPEFPNPPPPSFSPMQPPRPSTQPTPTQTNALVRIPAPIHGKKTRTNSQSNSQSLQKKSCPTTSSSTNTAQHPTPPTCSQPAPTSLTTSKDCSGLRPRSISIMTASNTARSLSPEL